MPNEIDTDYFQDVATCSFGDMLWDHERNEKFKEALKRAIKKRKLDGKSTHVLDIGTGTGLLAMMAVELGADSVVACEMFKPVANCALNIIHQNGLEGQIKLIMKKSTALTVGPSGDLPHRVDILVSEVFDTELIGEGAIETFNHAHTHLLKEDAIVIPSVGTVYCQLAESASLSRWNNLEAWMDGSRTVANVPKSVSECPGEPSLFDLQLSQLPPHQFTTLTEPFPLFKFEFMRAQKIDRNEKKSCTLMTKHGGKVQVVFFWWELLMDSAGEVILSCAPIWAHPQGLEGLQRSSSEIKIPWRDHWMQAVYFLPCEKYIHKNERVTLRGWHDEFSFWFDLCVCGKEKECSCNERKMPVCHCGLHLVASRTRLAALNDPSRRHVYTQVIKKLVKKTKRFFVLGDIGLLPLALIALGAESVDVLIEDKSQWAEDAYRAFPATGNHKIRLHRHFQSIPKDDGIDPICILAEPFYQSSLLPMDHLRFLKMKNELVTYLKQSQKREVLIFPCLAEVKCVAVVFDDLWKINRPLISCQGFKMKFLDDLISSAKAKVQNQVEPQPLWEYPCKAVSDVKTLCKINVASDAIALHHNNEPLYVLTGDEKVDGIVVWVDYEFEDQKLSTGPTSPIVQGEYVAWDQCERQGVYIFAQERSKLNGNDSIYCSASFQVKTGSFQICFQD